MKRLASIAMFTLIASIANGSDVRAESIVLECQMTGGEKLIFILNIAEEAVKFVKPEVVESGKLHISDYRYELQFPKSEYRWETHVRIERYSGDLSWEHGKPPFGQSSEDNVFRTGNCKKIDSKPKF